MYETASGTQIGLKVAGDFLSLAEVKRLCAEILPPYQMPMKIELVTKLEKNGSGKLKRSGKFLSEVNKTQDAPAGPGGQTAN